MKWVPLINISHNLFLSQSHAGKVVMRSWYERNKHIFPASRWEPYDPEKKWDKYTVRDLPFSSIYNSVHLFRFRTKVHPQDNDNFHAIHVMFLNWQLTWSILKFAKYFKQTTQLICEQEKEKRNYEETVLVRSWKEREIDCIHNVTALHVFIRRVHVIIYWWDPIILTLEDFGTSLCCPESGWWSEVQWNLNLFFLSIRTNAKFIEE